ncbi:hypothetical protein EZH22_25705 [Xanthobacter dioxanivorans]|uniref:ATP-grasp domain-containing protein n=1 Tax=Xanthobacter dioxanivorans TaxID=2528964 RepID=A0A974PMG5_9HYPH|nr:ATP-grasp domain-containing protein [Xanthobacter dioxanivorans]QRG06313.1 hypothetical protein EZH22_25705 [Xanthobacter dioxanivorans]
MLLIECDGKALFEAAGIPVPEGVVVTDGTVPPLPGDGPWLVKAQVPAGGRGKAGGVVFCATPHAVEQALARLLGRPLLGHVVRACLVERAARGSEAYLSLMADPAEGAVRLSFSDRGGVDVEATAREGGAFLTEVCAATPEAVDAAIERLAAGLAPQGAAGLRAVAPALARLFFTHELLLAEINPLFLDADGPCAGDAKVVADVNALARQPQIRGIVDARPAIYQDVWRKLHEGFDFIDLDPDGTIGLVTTGAGLSMMLIDELTARGGRPLNFCDLRTGQMRGRPDRLVRVLDWLAAKPGLKVLFVNIFVGITDLAEFARLLTEALAQFSRPDIPVVARLVGSGEAGARAHLAAIRPDLVTYADLDQALQHVIAVSRS